MTGPEPITQVFVDLERAGIHILNAAERGSDRVQRECWHHLSTMGLARLARVQPLTNDTLQLILREDVAIRWTPGCDTTLLCQQLTLNTLTHEADLDREIIVAMLASPVALVFPSVDEFFAAIRMRRYIVQAARNTVLNFGTAQAERPQDDWAYTEDRGYTLRPGRSLIEALERATQPGEFGLRYVFSCYRASEYIVLLAIAKEVRQSNPQLLHQLQHQWESRAIKSGEFHEVFLREHGSMATPLPTKFWVPGDRTWFRNPDAHSSDASGFEGSWVFYLGNGQFSNFWKWQQPFSLTSKCLELFHWRNATFTDAQGELRVDEDQVAHKVQATLQQPQEVERILRLMQRLRDPQSIYKDGGCIDTSRECPKWVCPGTSDLVLSTH